MTMEERKAIRGKLENLIPMIDELDKDWVCDWDDDKQEKYYVSLMHNVNKCFITADRTRQRIGAIYMSEATAKTVCDKINKSLEYNIKDGNGNVVVRG